jgi:hypothetical protein
MFAMLSKHFKVGREIFKNIYLYLTKFSFSIKLHFSLKNLILWIKFKDINSIYSDIFGNLTILPKVINMEKCLECRITLENW